ILFLSPKPYPLLSRRRKDRENQVLLQYRRTRTRCQSSGQQTASARSLTSLIPLGLRVLRFSLSGSEHSFLSLPSFYLREHLFERAGLDSQSVEVMVQVFYVSLQEQLRFRMLHRDCLGKVNENRVSVGDQDIVLA